MEFDELIQRLVLLSPEEKQTVIRILSETTLTGEVDLLDYNRLYATPELKEINRRSIEVVLEEKPCLVEFDEHLQSLQH